MFVDDGAEEFSIPPAGGEVVAAQTLVSLHHPLRPQQQLLFGRHVVGLTVHLDVGDLEPKDEEERVGVRGQKIFKDTIILSKTRNSFCSKSLVEKVKV